MRRTTLAVLVLPVVAVTAAACSSADEVAVPASSSPERAVAVGPSAPVTSSTTAAPTASPSSPVATPTAATPAPARTTGRTSPSPSSGRRLTTDATAAAPPTATNEATVPASPLPQGAAPAGRVVVVPCPGDDPVERPATMTAACADAGSTLTGLRWTSWGGAEATATGTDEENSCDPSCAGGKLVTYPVAVTLSRPLDRRTGRLYSVLTVTYPQAVPDGSDRTVEYPLAR